MSSVLVRIFEIFKEKGPARGPGQSQGGVDVVALREAANRSFRIDDLSQVEVLNRERNGRTDCHIERHGNQKAKYTHGLSPLSK